MRDEMRDELRNEGSVLRVEGWMGYLNFEN